MTEPSNDQEYLAPEDFEDIPPQPASLHAQVGNEVVEALADLFDEFNLPHTLEPGWTNRNPGYQWYSGSPEGVMLHHTATASYAPKRAYRKPHGDRTDGKDICCLLIQPDGVVNFITSGPANYSSGLNQKALLTDYVKKGVRFHGPQSGPLGPEWYGNRAWVNIEVVHKGDGSAIPEAQENAVIYTSALLAMLLHRDATCVVGHLDGRGTKVDPRWTGRYGKPPYTMAGIQDAVQALIDGDEIPDVPDQPDPPTGDEYMFPTIREGDGYIGGPHPEWRGAVVACQQMLAYHGFKDANTVDNSKCAADGAFGAGTETALKSFQRSRGLTQDGICGPQSWERLIDRRMA